jgi:NADH-quinone oxidoreductase subunit C
MTPEAIYEACRAKLGDAVSDFHPAAAGTKDAWLKVDPFRLEELGILLKTDPELCFDYLECITGVDEPKAEQIHVVYHVYSYEKRHRIVLKCMLDRNDPVVQTLSDVWPTANWQERECFDLLGVIFDGHPDLRRLLLPDDWEGHPLRKDYEEKDDYHGIPTVRPNPVELFAIRVPKEKEKAKPA